MHVKDNRNKCATGNQKTGIAIGMNTSHRHNRRENITDTTGANTSQRQHARTLSRQNNWLEHITETTGVNTSQRQEA